ncbi:MAG TPA: cation ABC transporter substrate-binding protein [Prolixibacteraceae bacterium]|nr:cation ABC transporter substrate-binding protein [Prolixibacteraceae bacterium]
MTNNDNIFSNPEIELSLIENVNTRLSFNLNMKKFLYLIITIILFACQPKQKETTNMVSVSILPQKYFIEQIAGELLHVNVLVPPGSSPHNYSVLPSQMKDLAKSKVWLQIGLLTFEDAWKDKFAEINKNLVIVKCSEGIEPIAGSDHEEESHGHEHAEAFDPHVWLAPAEVKTMAQNTLNALNSSFPEHATTFRHNYSRFISKIDSLSEQIEMKLAPLTNRNILIFHPALGYYARQFKLEQIPLELDGKEPSPKHMKTIVDLARDQNIRVIFIQKEFDAENALQLSREIGGEVITIDPLDYNWEKQMLDISEKIAAQK